MSNASDDSDVVELALELPGLSVTVRGTAARAVDFIRQVAPGTTSQRASSASGGIAVPEGPAASGASQGYASSGETRDSILSGFTACPQRLIAQAEANLSRSRISPDRRAERAWLAGSWAKAVLDGRVSSPNRTETIELGNRFWVVLRCSRCTTPRVFTTSAAFFAAVGALAGSDSVTHAFPSETEARIYLEAAGFEFPGLN